MYPSHTLRARVHLRLPNFALIVPEERAVIRSKLRQSCAIVPRELHLAPVHVRRDCRENSIWLLVPSILRHGGRMDLLYDAWVLVKGGGSICEKMAYLFIVSGEQGGDSCSRAGSRWQRHILMRWVGFPQGAGQELCALHVKVVSYW